MPYGLLVLLQSSNYTLSREGDNLSMFVHFTYARLETWLISFHPCHLIQCEITSSTVHSKMTQALHSKIV